MTFDDALARFLELGNAAIEEHRKRDVPNWCGATLSASNGKKYVRIVSTDRNGSSVSAYCFIERETGNILKADGWKRPAKGVRGNIYADNPLEGTTVYGAVTWR